MTTKTIVEQFVKDTGGFDLITKVKHAENLSVDIKLFNDLEKASKHTIKRCLAYEKTDETKKKLAELKKQFVGKKWQTIKGKSARIRLSDGIMIVTGKTRVNGLYIVN